MRFTKRLFIAVIGSALAATLLMVSAPKTVHAVVAALVRDVDNPGRATIVPLTCTAKPTSGGGSGCVLTSSGSEYTVPAGQRLVIEQVSAACQTPPTQVVNDLVLMLTEQAVSTDAPLVLTAQGTEGGLILGGPYVVFASNQSVHYYADPSTTLAMAAQTTDGSGNTQCRFAVNGYLISYP